MCGDARSASRSPATARSWSRRTATARSGASLASRECGRLLAIFPAVEHKTLWIFHIGKSPVYEVPVDGRSHPLRIMSHRQPRTAVVDVFVGNRLPRHAIAIGHARQYQRLLNANKSPLAIGLAFVETDRPGVGLGFWGGPGRIPSRPQSRT